MAETTTSAFALPQWGVENVDGPDMGELNSIGANIESFAAYDDGLSYTTLPTTGLFPKRYVRVSTTDGSYSLYRRQGSTWEWIGGPVAALGRRTVALSGQAGTDKAWTAEATLGTATAYATYQGDLASVASLRTSGLFAAAPLADTLTVGTTGRVYVKTQAAGDLGLVLRAHASTAGNLLTAREQGGSDVLTVDSSGRLVARTPAAFGGAALPSTSVLAVAPTSGSDGVTNGLLLTGNASDATRSVLRALAAPTDTASIAAWRTNGMSVGKLPWGTAAMSDGQINSAADVHTWRSVGANLPGSAQFTSWFAFQAANPTAQTDPSQDQLVFSMGSQGAALTQPLFLSQEKLSSLTNLTLYRFTDFTAGRFMELIQTTRTSPTTFTFNTVSDWNADGRLRAGTAWKGANSVRDARQSIHHLSTKVYAVAGDGPTVGIKVNPSTTFTYSFPTMTSRSFGGCDLLIGGLLELYLVNNRTDGSADGQSLQLQCWISINGGSFNEVDYQDNAQSSSPVGIRVIGDVLNAKFLLQSIPNGAIFQIQLRVSNGSSSPTLYIRKLGIDVEESTFEVYTAI
jgi:hypothetical protein